MVQLCGVLTMTETNKTLYIPLYGKAEMSKQGIILQDEKAEEIWGKEGFDLNRKSKSIWLCYYMAMRRRVFDIAVTQAAEKLPGATVLHIGCGMDSRRLRINCPNQWYDMDFEDVITRRRKYYAESDSYKMLAGDATQPRRWLHSFKKGSSAIVVMEGVTMYLSRRQLEKLISGLQSHFSQVIFIADFYTTFGAKASKYKNPVKDVGAAIVSGMDSPQELIFNSGIKFVKEWNMTPEQLINEIPKHHRRFFRKVMAGSFAKKLYRMYEYDIKNL